MSARGKQMRVLRMYVMMLGLVFILFYEAMEPGNWTWIARPAASPEAGDGAPKLESLPPAAPISEELRKKLGMVRDDSLQIRPGEQEVYWEAMRKGEEERWGERMGVAGTYPEVMEGLGERRGELISVSGRLRRLMKYEVEESVNGGMKPRRLYEGWFFTPDSGTHPWVVQFVTDPGIEPGDELSLPIEVTGMLFKKYQYESKGGLTAAPLLITDRVRVEVPRAEISGRKSRRWSFVPLAVLMLGILVAMKITGGGGMGPLRRRKSASSELPERIELPSELSEVKDV